MNHKGTFKTRNKHKNEKIIPQKKKKKTIDISSASYLFLFDI